jgi:HlyD family secretion protein
MVNMSGKKKLIIAAVVLAALITVVAVSVNSRRQDLTSVQTGEVERVDELIAKVNATGEIKPKEYVELQAEISGVITHLYVEEGDFVNKGDLLLKIDPTQTQADARAQQAMLDAAVFDASNQEAQITLQETNLSRERANVRAAEADLERAKQASELAKNSFERKQNLFEDNLLSRDLYEAAKNEMVGAHSGWIAAEARLEQAKASLAVAEIVLSQSRNSHQSSLSRAEQTRAILARAQDSLSKTNIASPLTGVITQLNVEVGERAVPGTLNNPMATIMIIADLSVIEAEIEVDETDIVRVALDQEAEIDVDALPDQPLKGVVTEIGNSAIPTASQQEAKDFKVVIRLNDPPKSLRPGLSCTADITTATRTDVLTIPIQALTVRELDVDDEGNPVIKEEKESEDSEEESQEDAKKDKAEKDEFEGVFVVEDKVAKFVPVETGILGDTNIEIQSGVEEGKMIVTGSYKALRTLADGDRVKVEKKGD